MQNLVSKNPVQRFKQGRKIVKAQNGQQFIYYKGRDGKDYEAWRGGNDWYYRQKGTTGMTRMPYDYITTTGQKFYNSTSKGAVANTYDVVNNMSNKQQDVPVTGKMVSNKSPLWDINYKIDNYINGFNSAQQGKIIGSKLVVPRSMKAGYNDYKNSQAISKQTITKPVNNRWVNGIQKRDEITDVRATQQMLKDAGFDIGKYGVDGKWGKDTENAYQQYLALKNIPIYERIPEQTVDISSPSKILNSTIINQESLTPEQQTEQNIVNNNLQTTSNPFIPEQKVFARNGSYNRSQIRDYMKQMGLNPYDFTGSERKALRLWLNGQSNDNSLLTGRLRDLFVTPYGYKQGGQLVSRNPITRFKNKKK